MTDIHSLLKLMVDHGASDLFITCGAAPHLKVEGVTRPVDGPALQRGEVKAVAYSIMSERQRAAFEDTFESNLSLSVDDVGRFRVNVYFQRGEVAMVVRYIKSKIPSFEGLGLPAECAKLAMLKHGLVLLVGAAGSGKSTSMAAMVGYRAAHADGHILTIEDPIEFVFRHGRSLVDQREVGIDTRSFGDALRNAMREAPDVIVLGEIRDQETAKHAIAYSVAGHLCMATLHANNANEALERIINFFPEQAHPQLFMDLSLNLKAVVSQRLVPATDGKLALATEVMMLSGYVSDLIHKGRVDEIKDAMFKGGEVGMHTFDQSLFALYKAGRISLDNALANADSHTDLALRIRLSEPHADVEASKLSVQAAAPPRLARR